MSETFDYLPTEDLACADGDCCPYCLEFLVGEYGHRRTCTMEYQTGYDNPKRGWFECSECGGLSDSVGSGWNGEKKRVNPPKFCAICGAKVVEK